MLLVLLAQAYRKRGKRQGGEILSGLRRLRTPQAGQVWELVGSTVATAEAANDVLDAIAEVTEAPS